jgi:zinc/manganese transport system permease protein
MFSGFMLTAWEAATMVAIVAGVVGFFTVLRGSAFPAHALPNGAFAGAAAASLVGIDPLVGLAAFSGLGALAIAALGRWTRNDVATALVIVTMLGIGSLCLSQTTEYADEIYALLFGEILGVSANELAPTALMAVAAVAIVVVAYRPLLLTSVLPDVAESQGIRTRRVEVGFLLLVALVTTMAVPVVGALLIFSLLIGPAAAARSLTSRPALALALSVAIALATVWSALALSYLSNVPVGFYVGSLAAAVYALGRGWQWWRERSPSPLARSRI